MGFGTSLTHAIFFIASAIVALALVSVMTSAVFAVSNSISMRGKLVSNQLATDIVITNDPCFVNKSVYVRNVGNTILSANITDIYIDGNFTKPEKISKYNDASGNWIEYDGKWQPFELLNFSYSDQLPRGIHTLRVATEYGVYDSLDYNTNCP